MKQILALDPATRCGYAHSCGDSGVWDLRAGAHPGKPLVRLRDLILAKHRERGIEEIAAEDASFGAFNPATAADHNKRVVVI